METTNHPFRNENDLPNPYDYVPCESSRVYGLLFQHFLGCQTTGGLVVKLEVSFAVLPRGSIAQVEQHAMHGSHEAFRDRKPTIFSSKIPG